MQLYVLVFFYAYLMTFCTGTYIFIAFTEMVQSCGTIMSQCIVALI